LEFRVLGGFGVGRDREGGAPMMGLVTLFEEDKLKSLHVCSLAITWQEDPHKIPTPRYWIYQLPEL
jgi:hypothetical protein